MRELRSGARFVRRCEVSEVERETGVEPATSSLGKWTWIVNKEHMRPLR